jgi:hypothetical protein
MKRIGYLSLAVFALALGLTAVAQAQTPNPNGAFVSLRYWNSCPVSTVTSTNAYPASIHINDTDPFSFAGWNKHLWKFSEDGGATQAVFHNASNYKFGADVTISGNDPSELEGGIELSPWWSDGDGQFMINPNSGEIAVFGGRLPFASNHATTYPPGYFAQPDYVAGSTITLQMQYIAGAVDPTISGVPAQVTYYTVNGGTTYQFGPLAFDQGNTAENPPHGLWGSLEPTSVGGYMQCGHQSDMATSADITWSNITYTNLQSTPAHTSTWGSLKALYR